MLFLFDTSELKLELLSTLDTKFVICKDRHLHTPKPNLVNLEEESLSPRSEGCVLAIKHKTMDVNECENRVPGKKDY